MAKDSSSLITLGVLAVGGYFAYEYFFKPAATTPAAGGTTPPAGGTTPSAGGTTPTGSGGGVQSSAPVQATVTPSSLDAIYSQMKTLIQTTYHDTDNFIGSGDNLTGTPYHFNTYLKLAAPSLNIPDPVNVFGTLRPIPGSTQTSSVDIASSPMPIASYWATMAPALKALNNGLSGMGLGMYAGLGCALFGRTLNGVA